MPFPTMTEAITPRPIARTWMLVAGLVGLAGLLIQSWVTYHLGVSWGLSFIGIVSKYFSYFTILTNLLVASALLAGSLVPHSAAGRFSNRPAVATGLFLYIAVVGIVYVSILAGLWKPQGLQWWADILLHYTTPVLSLIYWSVFVPKVRLAWIAALKWLAFPAAYLAWSLIRGSVTGDYPYPFIDVAKLGWPGAIVNCLLMTGLFLGLGLALVGISRRLAR